MNNEKKEPQDEQTSSVISSENECKRLMKYRLKSGAKYKDIVKLAAEQWSTLGTEWTGGNFNSAEQLAAAAIAEVYELADAIDTDFNAGVRRIAEFAEIPYSTLLTFYAQHTIFSNADPEYCTYIPYKILKKWNTEYHKKQ